MPTIGHLNLTYTKCNGPFEFPSDAEVYLGFSALYGPYEQQAGYRRLGMRLQWGTTASTKPRLRNSTRFGRCSKAMHFPSIRCTGLELSEPTDGCVVVRERRRLGWLRAAGDTIALALLLAVVARTVFLAATSNALWALGTGAALVGSVAFTGRAISAYTRDEVSVDKDRLVAGDLRLRKEEIAAIAAEDDTVKTLGFTPGLRVTCLGGHRQHSFFQGAPLREREAAATAMRALLGVPAQYVEDHEPQAVQPGEFV